MPNRRKNLTPVQRRQIIELLKIEPDVKKVARQLKLSTSTVYRIKQAEGGGPMLAGSDTATWANQMEQSGHWQGLRNATTTLAEQLWAPVQQLLNMLEFDIRNQFLIINCSGETTYVGLTVEDDLLFHSLKEHFPNHTAWSILEEWKGKVGRIYDQSSVLCGWVLEHLEGSVSKNLLNEGFASTVVSNVVEDVYFGRPMDDFHRTSVENEYEISPTGNTW